VQAEETNPRKFNFENAVLGGASSTPLGIVVQAQPFQGRACQLLGDATDGMHRLLRGGAGYHNGRGDEQGRARYLGYMARRRTRSSHVTRLALVFRGEETYKVEPLNFATRSGGGASLRKSEVVAMGNHCGLGGLTHRPGSPGLGARSEKK